MRCSVITTIWLVATCLVLICAPGSFAQQWSKDIQLTFPADTGSTGVTDFCQVTDLQGNQHILYNFSNRQYFLEGFTRLFYLRLDSTGRVLDRIELSDTIAGYENLKGILDSHGNIHFFWYHFYFYLSDYSVDYLRVSPDGELLDGPRELTRNLSTTPIPIVRWDGAIFISMKCGHDVVVRGLSEDGVWADDSLVVTDIYNGVSQAGFTIDQHNIAHFFKGDVSIIHNVHISYTAVRLNGEVLYRDYALTPTASGYMSGVAGRIEVDRSGNILMPYSQNNELRLRKFDTPEDTLWDRLLIEDVTGMNSRQVDMKLDSSENLHYCFEMNKLDTISRMRFHLTYGVIGPDGNELVRPYWIGSDHRVERIRRLHLFPLSLERTSVTAVFDLAQRDRLQWHLFIKILPYLPEIVIPDSETAPLKESFRVYPNPSNGTTTINFALPTAGKVTLAVYDMIGREVANLVDKEMKAGNHQAVWQAEGVPTGIYLIRLEISDKVQCMKATLLK